MTESYSTIPLEQDKLEGYDSLIEPKRVLHPNDVDNQSFWGGMMASEDKIETTQVIKSELEATGESPTMETIRGFARSDRNAQQKQQIEIIIGDSDTTLADKKAAVTGFVASQDTVTEDHIDGMTQAIVQDVAETEEEAQAQDLKIDGITQLRQIEVEKKQAHNAALAALNPTVGSFLTDVFGIILPFMETIDINQIANDLKDDLGFEVGIADIFLYGNLKRKIIDGIQNLDAENQVAVVKKLIKSIESRAGIVLDNDFIKFYLMTDLLEQGVYGGGLQTLDNIVGVVDAMIPGAAALKMAKTSYKARKLLGKIPDASVLARVNRADPRKARDLAAMALADKTGEVSRILGIDEVDMITDFVFPKPVVTVGNAPAKVVERLEEIELLGEDLAKIVETSGIVFTDAEKKAARFNALKNLRNLQGMVFRLADSVIVKTSEGFSIKGVFGANETHGFVNIQQAETQARRAFTDVAADTEDVFQNVTIHRKDPVTGEITDTYKSTAEVDAARGKKGEYFIEYEYKHPYDVEAAQALGADAVSFGWMGRIGKYALPVSSRFSNTVRAGMNRSADVSALVEKSLIHAGLKPLLDLGNRSQAKVMKMIETGARTGKNYKWNTLRTLGGMSEKEALSYLSFRKAQDMLWSVNNRDLYKDLVREGYNSVHIAGTDTGFIAKAIDESKAIISANIKDFKFFNPATDTDIAMTSVEVSELYARGGTIATLKASEKSGRKSWDFIIVDPLKKTKISKLTDTPLPYKDGYYQRFYKDSYFARVTYKNARVNGVKIEKSDTIGVGRTPAEAQAILDRFVANATEEELENIIILQPVRGRELQMTDSSGRLLDQRDLDLAAGRMSGLASRRQRGEILEGADELAEIEDPIHSFMRSVHSISNHVSMKTWSQTQMKRFSLNYPELVRDGWPVSVKEIKQRAKTLDKNQIGQAIQLFEYIETMRGVPLQFSKSWRDLMLNTAELLDRIPGLQPAARGAIAVSGVNPLSVMKSSAFIAFLALNPFRQVYVQSSQLMQMMAIDAKYVVSQGMLRDMMSFALMYAGRGTRNEKELLAMGRKLYSGPDEEFELMFNAWETSGLRLSIDASTFVQEASAFSNRLLIQGNINRQVGKQIVGTAGKAAGRALQAARVAGFDFGELMNLMGSYLTAVRRFKKMNPDEAENIFTRGTLDQIASDARELSYNMARSGKMGYQGYSNSALSEILSIPTQFMSVTHKGIATMLPEAIGGSRVLTGTEKAKLAGLNFILFGTSGIFLLSDAFDAAIEALDIQIPDDMYVAFKGGMMDAVIIKGAQKMFGVDTSKSTLSVSQSIAPAGGGVETLERLFPNLLEGSPLDILGGVPNTMGSRVYKAAIDFGNIMRMPDLDTDEKIKRSFMAVSSIASGFSNYYKHRFMMNTGKTISGNGNVGLEVDRSAAIAKLFGIPTYEEQAFYKTQKEIFGKAGNKINDTIEKTIRSDTKEMYASLKRIYVLYAGNERDIEVNRKMLEYVVSVYSDRAERQIVTDEFIKLMAIDQNKGVPSLVTYILEHNLGGDISEELRDIVLNNQAIDENSRQLLLDQIDSFK